MLLFPQGDRRQTSPPVLGNDALAQAYGITSMPDTFLIDRNGKVAAAYRAGLVDRGDIEANVQLMLSQR